MKYSEYEKAFQKVLGRFKKETLTSQKWIKRKPQRCPNKNTTIVKKGTNKQITLEDLK